MKTGTSVLLAPLVWGILSCCCCDTHYVSTTGSNQYPYSTRETAASKIQDAVDAAESGDTVAVAEGEYNESIQIKEGIALRGAGPELTAIVYEPS